ncbi:MAG: PorT family protein [Bacteroidia bacterium]|nr:PorT family protein [Bacteroidia bacterium]
MKKLLLLIAVITALNVNGQGFVLGAKVGLTNTQIIGADVKSFQIPSSSNGFLIGGFTRFCIAGFYLQPEISFRNLNFTVNNTGTTSAASTATMLNYIDVPVMFGKKILKVINLSAGPNFQFLVNKDLTASNITMLEKGDYNDFVVGAQLGIGIEIWKLCFDARYDFSINSIGNVATNVNNTQNVNFSSRASMFQFTIGYKFIDL